MANGELIDAREAMTLLGIGENELQSLVARGDLRAFRAGGTMKFRRDDVVELKTERGTEPTIIIPSVGQRRPGQSGILQATDAAATAPSIVPAQSGGRMPVAREPGQTDATGEIVFDDIELLPTDDGLSTQQVTVQQPAIGGGMHSGITADYQPTVIEPAASTGEMTVVESSADEAAVSTGPAQPIGHRPAMQRAPSGRPEVRRGSEIRQAAPAISRIRQPAVAASRRVQAVYQAKTAHPVWTVVMILNAAIFIFTAAILGLYTFRGVYDRQSGERVIPPALRDTYESMFYGDGLMIKLPGQPNDDKSPEEPNPSPPAD
jgi:hypothetical protein